MSMVLHFTADSAPGDVRLYVSRSDGQTYGSADGVTSLAWGANADARYLLPIADTVFALRYNSVALSLGASATGAFAFYDGAKSTGVLLTEVPDWETDANQRSLLPEGVDAVKLDGTAQRATDLAEIAQYLIANAATLTDVIADDSILAKLMATGGDISEFFSDTDALQAIRDNLLSPSVLVAQLTGSALEGSKNEFWMVEDDTGPPISITVTDEDGNTVAVKAPCTARFYETGSDVLILSKSTTDTYLAITNGDGGVLSLTWQASDWTALTQTGANAYEVEIECTRNADTKIQSVKKFLKMHVRAKRNVA